MQTNDLVSVQTGKNYAKKQKTDTRSLFPNRL